MLAIANAASAATSVETITAPPVRITEFLNHVTNSPPFSAAEKLPNSSGHGRPSTSSEYCSSLFTDVSTMNSTGIIAPIEATIRQRLLEVVVGPLAAAPRRGATALIPPSPPRARPASGR